MIANYPRRIESLIRRNWHCDLDIVHDVLLEIERHPTQPGKSESCRIDVLIRMRQLDQYRRERRWTNSPTMECESSEDEPLRKLLTEEQAGQLQSLLARLPGAQREVVELHFYEGLSVSAIAARRGASVQSVSQMKERAIEALRIGFNREVK